MDIRSLLNHDSVPFMATCVPVKGNERVGKNRVEKPCPSCGKKNHIRTTNCKSCSAQLRASPSKSSTRSSRNSSRTSSARAPKQKGSVAAILNAASPTVPHHWSPTSAHGGLEYSPERLLPEARRASEVLLRGKHSKRHVPDSVTFGADYDTPPKHYGPLDPQGMYAPPVPRTPRNHPLGSSRSVHKGMRNSNGRRAVDRTSRPCRNCSTQNHIRVTLCAKCRRSLRPSGS